MTERRGKKIERLARTTHVPLGKMRVNPLVQREFNQSRADHLLTNFDPELIGVPVVSLRDGTYYIVDGQHRIFGALIPWLGEGWGDQTIECSVYEGMSEAEEAEMFLKVNDTLKVNAMETFKVGIRAGRKIELDIDRIVRANELCVTSDRVEGAVRAVGTLVRVYNREGPVVLGTTLALIRDAYGNAGFEAAVIDGIGYLCGRYNGELDIPKAVERLANTHAGVNGLLNQAEVMRRQTGNPKGQCIAATAVDLINRGRGGTKLSSWWAA